MEIILVLINLVRFFGIDFAPPGFYVDEAAGAAQVMCLEQTGHDFYHQSYPLFVHGLGGGYYTWPFLYSEFLWTSLFGTSVTAFRTLIAFVTTLTILFLYLWLKNAVNRKVAISAALLASVSPWVFQFSRIAWDPPFAPFFIVLGLYFFQKSGRIFAVGGALAFACASYSYPPSRIQVFALLLLLPAFTWSKKLKAFAVFCLALIPMAYQTLTDPGFTARGQMLAIWSTHPANPFRGESVFALAYEFFAQWFAHFGFSYLFLSGDRNLRHSTGHFGLFSFAEMMILMGALVYALMSFFKKTNRKEKSNEMPTRKPLFLLGLGGVITGIAPAALTWESVPHALRSIGAWPFFVLLFALLAERFSRQWKRWFDIPFLAIACLYFILFANIYFTVYPNEVQAWFQDDQTDLGSAYRKMHEQGKTCAEL